MEYYCFWLGDICYAEIHDSIHDHYTEPGYRPWGHIRDGNADNRDYSWPIDMFLGPDGELLDVFETLRRWLIEYALAKHGKFYCCAWIWSGVYLESPIFDNDYRMGVSRTWHEISSFNQLKWFFDSDRKWKCQSKLEVPAGEAMAKKWLNAKDDLSRGILHAQALTNMDSSPAPKEWESINVIAAARPNGDDDHVSLHLLDGARGICQWMVKRNHLWNPVGDFFKVDTF